MIEIEEKDIKTGRRGKGPERGQLFYARSPKGRDFVHGRP
jgi:hypothetical protein